MVRLNEIVAEVEKAGARLYVVNGKLGLHGKVDESLQQQIIENRHELAKYLTWDQETAIALFRQALDYLNKHYVKGAENPQDGKFSILIDTAFMAEHMWKLRTAVRGWVVSWMAAIDVHKKTVTVEVKETS